MSFFKGPYVPKSFEPQVSSFAPGDAQHFAEAVYAGDVKEVLATAKKLKDGLNTHDPDGNTGLMLALYALDKKMIHALLDAGADPNGTEGRAPVALAVRAYDIEYLQMFLDAGADPNGMFADEPALLVGARLGDTEPVGILLEAGAKIDALNAFEKTPLLVAGSVDNWIMAEFLLQHGASPWIASDNGLTIGNLAEHSRLLSNNPEGQARDRVKTYLQAQGYPWPPPTPEEMRTLLEEGKWPHQTVSN
jgi:ankyrin repeat protein